MKLWNARPLVGSVCKLLAVGDVLYGGVLGLENRRGRGHGQRFLERAKAQFRVDARIAVGHEHVPGRKGLEARHRDDNW